MAILITQWGTQFYETRGTAGPAVLFLHGTGCDSEDWHPTLAQIEAHLEPLPLRAIVTDFRGHGRSSTPGSAFSLGDLGDDVLLLIEHLAVDDVVIVGHSLGGMVAMDVAGRSDLVRGLVLLEGWTSLSAAEAFDEGRFYGRLAPRDIRAIQRRFDATRNRIAPEVWNAFWASVERFDASEYLESAQIPILEAYGSLGRREDTEQRLRVPPNPNIRWLWIPAAGHYLPHERPLDVADACVSFLVSSGPPEVIG
jgi:pimeloyl-ACP methyl ester carboxylesterase